MSDYINDFIKNRSVYERYTEKLKGLIEELLNSEGFDFAQVEFRTKSIESFTEKINRPEKNYSNPLVELTDICGIRIITYYIDDVYRIGEYISKEFSIDVNNSVDKNEVESPDKFGYASLHYVVKLNARRSKLKEWEVFKNLKAEIQIRTILQHSWAAIDHKLRYKTKNEIPSKIRREIFRLSALLELADQEFLKIRETTTNINKFIGNEIEKGNYEQEINAVSLIDYIKHSDQVNYCLEIAHKVGYIPFNRDSITQDQIDKVFVGRAINMFKACRIYKLSEIEALLHNNKSQASKALKEVFESTKKHKYVLHAVHEDILMILVYMLTPNVKLSYDELFRIIEFEPLSKALDESKTKIPLT